MDKLSSTRVKAESTGKIKRIIIAHNLFEVTSMFFFFSLFTVSLYKIIILIYIQFEFIFIYVKELKFYFILSN